MGARRDALPQLVDERRAPVRAPARARPPARRRRPPARSTPRERAKLRGAAATRPLTRPPLSPTLLPRRLAPPRRLAALSWAMIATKMPGRTGKQCRERWHNHLDPRVAKERWTEEENEIVLDAHRVRGNQARPPPDRPPPSPTRPR